MKLTSLAIIMAAICCSPVIANSKNAPSNLGKVMYVGDSITHGYAAPSYRWALHKIFIDNNIEYIPVGVEKGNNSYANKGTLQPDATYRNATFRNIHCAMSSERAYEISGRLHNSKRLDATDIFDWLGLDKTYKGPRKIEGAAPDTFFLLIGTNDTLSDYGPMGGIAAHIKEAQKALLEGKKADIPVILQAMRKANPKAHIVVLPIPTWGNIKKNNNTAEDYAAIAQYNKQLARKLKNKAIFADINKGLVDIACEDKPGKGVPSFFNTADQLHPSAHGDLIMAGHVAQAMGYPGRTAGAERKASDSLAMQEKELFENASGKDAIEQSENSFTLKNGNTKVAIAWKKDTDPSQGFTVEILPQVGDGAQNGWVKDKGLVVTLGNGANAGAISFTESYIIWNGKTILYPLDMSVNTEPIRIAWLPGNEKQNIPGGFYIWLGDMLIGEAQPSLDPNFANKINGIVLQNTAAEPVQIKALAMEDKPFAPAPTPKKGKEQ